MGVDILVEGKLGREDRDRNILVDEDKENVLVEYIMNNGVGDFLVLDYHHVEEDMMVVDMLPQDNLIHMFINILNNIYSF